MSREGYVSGINCIDITLNRVVYNVVFIRSTGMIIRVQVPLENGRAARVIDSASPIWADLQAKLDTSRNAC